MPIPFVVSSKLNMTNILPQMMYGLELLHIPPHSSDKLEVNQRYMARRIQGLPRTSATPTTLTTLGWWSLKSTLVLRRLMMLWQILLLPMNNIYKEIVVKRFLEHHTGFQNSNKYIATGPVALIYESAVWINMHDYVAGVIMDGSYITKLQWKSVVKDRI